MTMAFSYTELVQIAGGVGSKADVACPICGPSRRAVVNRARKTLRVWFEHDGFAGFFCARCGASGFAREAGDRRDRPRPPQPRREPDPGKRAVGLRIWSETVALD